MTLNERIAKDTAKTTLATILMQSVAFLVSIISAALFGANLRTDAFFLALGIPAIFEAAIYGALKEVFIPVFISYKTEQKMDEKKLLGSLYFSLIFLSILVLFVLMILTPFLVPLLARGFDEEGKRLAVILTYELLPLVLLTSLVGLFDAVYNSYQKFVAPILTPIVRSVVLIGFVLLFKERLGIHSLALGSVLGELIQVIILFIILKFSHIYVGLNFSIHPAFRRMARLSIPPILGNAVLKINPLIDSIMIAGLSAGAVTALNYANKLNEVPLLLIGSGGFLTVVLSYWSKTKSEGSLNEVKTSLEKSVITITLVLAPLIVALFVLREPTVRFFYERKEFTSEATQTTALLLGLLLIGVIPLIVGRTLTRVFFVLQDTLTPFWVGILRSIFNVGLNFVFRALWGLKGIALSTSVTSIILFFFIFYLVQRKIGGLNTKILSFKFLKIFLAMILSGFFIANVFSPLFMSFSFIPSLSLQLFLSLVLSSISGWSVFLLLLYILRLEEFFALKNYVFSRKSLLA